MAKGKQSYLRRKINRLEREIASIDKMLYLFDKDGEPSRYAGMLERKRDDMIRSGMLQLHTSIEDILNEYIMCRVLSVPAHERMNSCRHAQERRCASF